MKTNSKLRKRILKCWPLYTMLIPGMVYLIINNYLPMFGILIAFKKINYALGIFKSPWVGFSNFTYLLASNDAYIMFRNTILYNVAFIILGNVLALVVAIALDTVKNRAFRNVSQVIILIPNLLSTIIITYIVYAFLNEQHGFMNNSILAALHINPISWYNTPGPWPIILTIVYLWMSIGYTSILYYSTLIGIDKTYYEAAVVDGASLWQQIFRITLPCMKKTIVILLILAVGRICYSDFGLFYQVPMHSGLLYPTTQTIDTFVYRALLEQNSIGRSSAAGLFQSVLGFVLVVTTNLIVRKVDEESSLF